MQIYTSSLPLSLLIMLTNDHFSAPLLFNNGMITTTYP